MSIGQSSFRLFLSKSGNSLVYFAGLAFFARQLTPEELGAFFLFMTLRGILSIPADLGINSALEKRMSEGLDPERTLGSALVFKIGAMTVMLLGVLVARGPINKYMGADLAVLLIAAIVAHELGEFYIRAVRGELRAGETASIEFVRRSVWVGMGAALAAAGFGAQGLAIGVTVGSVVAFVFGYLLCDTAIGRPSIDLTRSLIAFSKYATVNSVGGRVYQWMDVAIIGFLLTQQAVSAYELTWQVTLLVLLVSKSIAKAIFPQFSQWNAESATDRIESALSKSIGVALFVSIPALIGASVYASEILEYIYGPQYTFAAGVLVVLMVEKLFQSFDDLVGESIGALDRPDLAAKATVIALIVNIILSPLLAISFGLIGVAVGTTVSWLIGTTFRARYLSRFVSMSIPYRLLGWYTVSSLLMGGFLLVLKTAIPITNVFILLLQVGFGVAVYIGLAAAVPDVRNRIIIPGLEVLGLSIR